MTSKSDYKNQNFCIDCVFLPQDLDCKVKVKGEVSQVHITTHACHEFLRRVVYD